MKLRPKEESAENRMIIQIKPLLGVGFISCTLSVNMMSNNEATTKANTIFKAYLVRSSIFKSFFKIVRVQAIHCMPKFKHLHDEEVTVNRFLYLNNAKRMCGMDLRYKT